MTDAGKQPIEGTQTVNNGEIKLYPHQEEAMRHLKEAGPISTLEWPASRLSFASLRTRMPAVEKLPLIIEPSRPKLDERLKCIHKASDSVVLVGGQQSGKMSITAQHLSNMLIKGETVCVAGPTGSGKQTLAAMACKGKRTLVVIDSSQRELHQQWVTSLNRHGVQGETATFDAYWRGDRDLSAFEVIVFDMHPDTYSRKMVVRKGERRVEMVAKEILRRAKEGKHAVMTVNGVSNG